MKRVGAMVLHLALKIALFPVILISMLYFAIRNDEDGVELMAALWMDL